MASSRARLWTGLCGLLALSNGCASPQRGGAGTGNTPNSQVGNVRNYTDSDVINGVAVSDTNVFVATARGVLRYRTAENNAVTRYGTRQGLPDSRAYAISASADGSVFVSTARGVARWLGDRFAPVGEANAQPNVGRPTAIAALDNGGCILGGAQGLAHWDGRRWYTLTDRFQVTSMVVDATRVVVTTAQSGIVILRAGEHFEQIEEHGNNAGIPETLVRSVVPLSGGRMWALVQAVGGAKLAFYDGHRWYAYTSEHVRSSPWLGLARIPGTGDNVALITRSGLFEIVTEHGQHLAALDASNPDGVRRSNLEPAAIEPPAPPPTPAQPPPPAGGRGRGRGRPAGRGRHAPVAFATDALSPAPAQPAVAQVSYEEPWYLREPEAQRGAQQPAAGGAGAADAGAAAPAGDAAAPTPRQPPPRPRDIPAYSNPVDAPQGQPHVEAPTFGLQARSDLAAPEDLAGAWNVSGGLYLWRIGLGVTRPLGGGGAAEFRTHDLALSRRPLSLATDTSTNVWFVTEDGGAVRYDGTRFSRVALDNDDTATPLLFWSRGTLAVAVGRVGNNILRTYRYAGNGWQQVTERPIDTGGPGLVDVKFLAVDASGRYWCGIRVRDENGEGGRDWGVAVLDENTPAALQFYTQGTGQQQQAAPRAPNDVTAVAFDSSSGTAWLAALSSGVSITLPRGGAPTVATFNEATGLRGDNMIDVSAGPRGRVYFTTPEALGYREGDAFHYDLPGSGQANRVISLAVDVAGNLWGAGPRGAWRFDGTGFTRVGRQQGLPVEEFNDVAVDGENRVWFVTPEGISILTQPRAGGSSGGSSGNLF